MANKWWENEAELDDTVNRLVIRERKVNHYVVSDGRSASVQDKIDRRRSRLRSGRLVDSASNG